MNDREERLEAIRRELRKQNETWERAREALSRAGNVLVAVPSDALEALEAPLPGASAPATPHAIRA
jgi:hypothetical protein